MRAPALLLRRLRWLMAAAVASLVAGCGVIGSQRIDLDAPPMAYDTPCHSALGSYALPKAFVRLRIGQKKNSAPDIAVGTGDDPLIVQVIRHPDPHLSFCLDYLNSPLSDDNIQVVHWSSTPDAPRSSFLGAVLVNVTDQTAYIVRTLIRTAFIALTGKPDFAPRSAVFDPSEIIVDYEFDPFNQREMATINARLSKLGFCVTLEDYTFDPAIGIQRYCDAPLRHSVSLTPFYKAYHRMDEAPADPQIQGLMYRPIFPYRLFIYHKRDAGGRDPWLLQNSTTVLLENLSPLLSLRVSRAMFARKTMNFIFQEGTLKTACLSKTSELAGFVEIPLEIARSIVQVPGAIMTVRINDVNSEKDLVAAQQNLFQMQQTYMQAVMGGNPSVGHAAGIPTTPQFNDITKAPTDIQKLSTAGQWGSDLFNGALSTVCGGDPT